jgi:hypothetical protein
MTKRFVAINDPVHRFLRRLTLRTPLHLLPAADGSLVLEYAVQPDALPGAYFSLAAGQAVEGLPHQAVQSARGPLLAGSKAALLERAGYFDAVRLDRRCSRDLRLKCRKNGAGMLAAELLTYGTGTLRARNDDPAEGAQRELWRHHGRIETRHEVVFARIRALQGNDCLRLRGTRKETFDSTNVILGDALGEIEQLWERRADTAFLGQVARSLHRLPRQGEIAAFLHPPLNLEAIIKSHLRAQALWRTPPANARGLLRRLEFILDHTTVDSAAMTRFDPPRPTPRPEAGVWIDRSAEWQADPTGYDGWLEA